MIEVATAMGLPGGEWDPLQLAYNLYPRAFVLAGPEPTDRLYFALRSIFPSAPDAYRIWDSM